MNVRDRSAGPGGLRRVLRDHLANAESAWSLGTLGVLAEFHRDRGERARIQTDALAVATGRGGLQILPHPHTAAVAYETPAADGDGWTHAMAFCLCEGHARRTPDGGVVRELGPDVDAIAARERAARLFHLGLGGPHIDACVRTADPALIATLRACRGRPLLDADNPAFAAIRTRSPHRVFRSRLGRIEVYQPIPTGGESSPQGPHTHVLPGLLARGRTHSPDVPVPPGYVCCLYLHPPGPFTRAGGELDLAHFQRFQALLERWGHPRYLRAKVRVMAAVREGHDPPRGRRPSDPMQRLASELALRQLRHLDGDSPRLTRWRAALEADVPER